MYIYIYTTHCVYLFTCTKRFSNSTSAYIHKGLKSSLEEIFSHKCSQQQYSKQPKGRRNPSGRHVFYHSIKTKGEGAPTCEARLGTSGMLVLYQKKRKRKNHFKQQLYENWNVENKIPTMKTHYKDMPTKQMKSII